MIGAATVALACTVPLPPKSAFSADASVSPTADGGATDGGISVIDGGHADAGTSDGGQGTGAIGAACTANSDCRSGDCELQVPGGYCSASCGRGEPCPDGSRCTEAAGGAQLCLKDCTEQSQCRTRYVCQPAEGVCNLPCENDGECSSGESCESSTGRCLSMSSCTSSSSCGPGQNCDTNRQCAGGAGLTGGTCGADSDCVHGTMPTCLTAGAGFPGGYCVSPCTLGGTACPDDGQCVQGVAPNGRVCVSTCTTSADCRYDYQCVPIPGRNSVCMPPCQANMLCGQGQQCDAMTGVCQGGGQVGGLNGIDAGM